MYLFPVYTSFQAHAVPCTIQAAACRLRELLSGLVDISTAGSYRDIGKEDTACCPVEAATAKAVRRALCGVYSPVKGWLVVEVALT